MSIFGGGPKPQKAPPPPHTPTRADASSFVAGSSPGRTPFSSLISTGPQGLKRKADTEKRTLIGGG